MLRYFPDFRIHPGSDWVLFGLPVTLSSDDSAIYGYSSAAPTFDFFMATVLWRLPLSSIYQIARNSLLYSALSSEQKAVQLETFDKNFNGWIEAISAKIKKI